MVEKIDKPEPPPAYFVQATTETKKDRGGSQQGQRESDEYSGSHAAPGWQKIYAASSNRRYLKIKREGISRAWLCSTIMQRGISLAEVDIELKSGELLKNAHVILSVREDFWTLKKFQTGQEVPLNLLLKEPVIEISVPMVRTPSTPQTAPQQQIPTENKLKSINNKLIIYAAIGAVTILLLLILFMR